MRVRARNLQHPRPWATLYIARIYTSLCGSCRKIDSTGRFPVQFNEWCSRVLRVSQNGTEINVPNAQSHYITVALGLLEPKYQALIVNLRTISPIPLHYSDFTQANH